MEHRSPAKVPTMRPHALPLVVWLAAASASCAATAYPAEPTPAVTHADPIPIAEPTPEPAPTPPPAPPLARKRARDTDGDRSFIARLLWGPADPPKKGARSLHAIPVLDERPWWDAELSDAEQAREAGGFRVEQGWYVGGLYAASSHSEDDLDGQKFLSGVDTIVLPEIDVGDGPGGVFGYRFEQAAFEFSYYETKHDSEWTGTDFDTKFQAFGIDFKHYYLIDQRLQPFLMLGILFPKLTIENGSSQGALIDDGELEDDLAIRFGGGLSLFLTSRIQVGGHVVYRFLQQYDEAEGVAPKGPIPDVDGGGFTAAVSLTYTF